MQETLLLFVDPYSSHVTVLHKNKLCSHIRTILSGWWCSFVSNHDRIEGGHKGNGLFYVITLISKSIVNFSGGKSDLTKATWSRQFSGQNFNRRSRLAVCMCFLNILYFRVDSRLLCALNSAKLRSEDFFSSSLSLLQITVCATFCYCFHDI